jgi:hypothetical protein
MASQFPLVLFPGRLKVVNIHDADMATITLLISTCHPHFQSPPPDNEFRTVHHQSAFNTADFPGVFLEFSPCKEPFRKRWDRAFRVESLAKKERSKRSMLAYMVRNSRSVWTPAIAATMEPTDEPAMMRGS